MVSKEIFLKHHKCTTCKQYTDGVEDEYDEIVNVGWSYNKGNIKHTHKRKRITWKCGHFRTWRLDDKHQVIYKEE